MQICGHSLERWFAMNRKIGIEAPILGIVLVVMLLIVSFNVLSRYVLHLSFSFIEELVCVMFVLLTTIGSSAASKDESHFTLDLFTGMMKPKIRNRVMILNNFLTLIAAAVLTVTGINMVAQQYDMGSISDSLRAPQWIYSLTLPLGCGLMCIRCIQVIVRRVKHWKEGEQQ